MFVAQAVIVLTLVGVHIYASRLRSLSSIPRSRWLSFAGGTAVAYVFLHIFPELKQAHDAVSDRWQIGFFREHLIYLASLAGIVTFYGLERIVNTAQMEQVAFGVGGERVKASAGVFWLHMASFSLYNALVGYLLVHREQESFINLLLFAVSLGFHFLVNDFSFHEQHRRLYHDKGRWLLAGSIVCGWILAQIWSASDAATSLLFAFLAGGIVLNVLKEELPESRKSRFMPFAIGALSYSILILIAGG